MKKQLSILILSFLFTSFTYSQSYKIDGEWYNEEKDAIITIKKKKDNTYSGYITWMKSPEDENGHPKTDPLNPDETLRSRARMGMEIMFNFEWEKDNQWGHGKIYDPKSGNTYRGIITMDSGNRLDLRGYVGISWFGRTSYWTRKIKDNI